MTDRHTLPQSAYFRLEKLADGVYAAISLNAGAASNAGIVDLGDGALVFDALNTPQAADDLIRAADALTGSPVRYVINSHWHGDHVEGNAALAEAGAIIISTARTRDILAEERPALIESFREQKPQFEAELKELQARLETENDEAERQRLQGELLTCRIFLEALPRVTLRLPDWTFERKLVVHGPSRAAEILTFGGGHTESDAILWLPDVGIAFIADLLFNNAHPWVGHGEPDEWLRILDDIDGLAPETVVPGHGPVGVPADLDKMRAYLPVVRGVVADLVAAEAADEAIASLAPPPQFSAWDGAHRFQNNVRALVARARGGPVRP